MAALREMGLKVSAQSRIHFTFQVVRNFLPDLSATQDHEFFLFTAHLAPENKIRQDGKCFVSKYRDILPSHEARNDDRMDGRCPCLSGRRSRGGRHFYPG